VRCVVLATEARRCGWSRPSLAHQIHHGFDTPVRHDLDLATRWLIPLGFDNECVPAGRESLLGNVEQILANSFANRTRSTSEWLARKAR